MLYPLTFSEVCAHEGHTFLWHVARYKGKVFITKKKSTFRIMIMSAQHYIMGYDVSIVIDDSSFNVVYPSGTWTKLPTLSICDDIMWNQSEYANNSHIGHGVWMYWNADLRWLFYYMYMHKLNTMRWFDMCGQALGTHCAHEVLYS